MAMKKKLFVFIVPSHAYCDREKNDNISKSYLSAYFSLFMSYSYYLQ